MGHFIQLHLLTAYPPANLNRDDMGRPKTAIMGGVKRLRVSSQSLKRTWRTSDLFLNALDGHHGKRTKKIGAIAMQQLGDKGVDEKKAREWAVEIGKIFGDVAKGEVETSQLVHIGPNEQQAVDELVERLAAEDRGPEKEELELLNSKPAAVDIALFGRMLAASPRYNVEAACQVAHAITVHGAEVEDDYFTAVDDLNAGDEHRGAAHVGETGFGAGLFYTYICIDRDQLVHNLDGQTALADDAIAALVEAAARTSPKGKQNSFGSRAHASYILAEKGDAQPRSLAASFLRPVTGQQQDQAAIDKLEAQALAFDQAYGPGASGRFVTSAIADYAGPHAELDAQKGSLQSLVAFLREPA